MIQQEIIEFLYTVPLMLRVTLIGSIPAIFTIIGSLPVLLNVKFTEKITDAGMGFAAGIMLVASFTSLLLPAINHGNIVIAVTGFIIGIILVKILDVLIPHIHFIRGYHNVGYSYSRKAWLMALAMIIHNIPEGMAVGASTTYDVTEGLIIAIAIAIQDIPEGFATALPVLNITKSKRQAFIISAISGIAELLAALIPPLIIVFVHVALPLMLAIASGAMIYVVVHEIIPEIYGHEHNEPSTIGFFIGFIVMLLLDNILS